MKNSKNIAKKAIKKLINLRITNYSITEVKTQLLKAIIKKNPGATRAIVAKELGVPRSTMYGYYSKNDLAILNKSKITAELSAAKKLVKLAGYKLIKMN